MNESGFYRRERKREREREREKEKFSFHLIPKTGESNSRLLHLLPNALIINQYNTGSHVSYQCSLYYMICCIWLDGDHAFTSIATSELLEGYIYIGIKSNKKYDTKKNYRIMCVCMCVCVCVCVCVYLITYIL